MSILSMTGFGAASFEADGLAFRVEVKAVNHRTLNVRFHTPRSFDRLEQGAAPLLRDRLGRGSVTVVVEPAAREGDPTGGAVEVAVDEPAASAAAKTLLALAERLGVAPPTLDTLLRLGDIVQVRTREASPDALSQAFLAGLDEALSGLEAMRRREGEALAADLEARLDRLGQLLDAVASQAPVVMEVYQARLRKRLDEAAERHGITLDEGRLAAELVIYSDKSDLTEEIVRARTHLDAFRALLHDADDAQGKRLDFLCQELVREFNTIGSKCRDADITGTVVETKVELERVREQIQNIA